ncbi:lamin tail domain-containing protein [Paraliomyxa miuraensis]|uniref:lamin tail domain-containing protein n=1 Tax=Paraliomyxa miuraensis TaxID=376150 RepID=UPI00225AB460|nr:lamin tail domain-containing protein [Paraliomyxa miuraensis]MCX4245249.1 lamin tail domain-containing protein [Paraliomyxa miuraensis]
MFELVRELHPVRRARPWLRTVAAIALLGSAMTASGCAREPAECLADLQEGDLVLTEIRGPQDGSRGEWFELYNATDRTLDLYGLRGTMRPLKGSEVDGDVALTFLVRDSLEVEAGAYVVLGTLPLDESRRPELDYSINDDFRREPPVIETVTSGVVELPPDENADPRSLFGNAILQFHACDRLVDELVYSELPEEGTLSYDGPLDAEDNDDLQRWCTDAAEAPAGGPQTATGLPGTGGEANRPCA